MIELAPNNEKLEKILNKQSLRRLETIIEDLASMSPGAQKDTRERGQR